jgi:plastocyanin domain-containing protein
MKNKTSLIIISLGLIVGMGIIFMGSSKSNNKNTYGVINSKTEQVQNVSVKDGIQYVTIDAKGGYLPRVSNAKSGIPTKLIVKTNGTYDCSASLVIRAIGYQKILPKTGEEVIDLGTPKAGVPIRGVCGMGMYSFVVNFE